MKTSEEAPYNFLADKPHTYDVATDGTFLRFTKTLPAQKGDGITKIEHLHLPFGHAAHNKVYQTLQKIEQAPNHTKAQGPQQAKIPCRTSLGARMKASRKPVVSRHMKAHTDSDWVPPPTDDDSDSDGEGPPELVLSEESGSEEEPSDDINDYIQEGTDSGNDSQRPKSRMISRTRLSPPHSGGKVPGKAAVKLADNKPATSKAAAKTLNKSKAEDHTAPGYITRSRTHTALPAGTAKADEICRTSLEDLAKEGKDQKRPHLRMQALSCEDVQDRSLYMLLTVNTSFGVSKVETQESSGKPQADPRLITETCRRADTEKWLETSNAGWENLNSLNAYDWADPPKNAQVTSTTMVFKKNNQSGELEKYKARLYARGDQQQKEEGEEQFSPDTRLNLHRLVLATAVEKKLHLKTADITGAYIYAPFGKQEDFYRTPPGFKRMDGKVMKLKKSLYGLGTSGRNWYQMFTGYLLELGFEKAGENGVVFFITSQTKNRLGVIKDPYTMIMVTYVGDTRTSTDNLTAYEAVISKLNEKFEVSHKEDATSFLGALITYNRQEGVLILSQEKFTYETLRNFGMEATPISTPTDSKIVLSKEQCSAEDTKDPKTVKAYQCLSGFLMWLTSVGRPDLTYATIKLAHYASNPRQLHVQAALRILRYLNGTRTLGLCYMANQDNAPPNMLNAKQQDKICIKLIKIITLSTTDAEYNALSESVKFVMYLQAVLEEIGRKQTVPTLIGEDNKGYLHLAVENRYTFDHTRHIAAKNLFLEFRKLSMGI